MKLLDVEGPLRENGGMRVMLALDSSSSSRHRVSINRATVLDASRSPSMARSYRAD